MTASVARQIVLGARPKGRPQLTDFDEPAQRQALLQDLAHRRRQSVGAVTRTRTIVLGDQSADRGHASFFEAEVGQLRSALRSSAEDDLAGNRCSHVDISSNRITSSE